MLGYKKTTLYILDGSLELGVLILQQVGIIKSTSITSYRSLDLHINKNKILVTAILHMLQTFQRYYYLISSYKILKYQWLFPSSNT